MTQVTQAAFDARVDFGRPNRDVAALVPAAVGSEIEIRLSFHDDLSEVEQEWRAFEDGADATAFQTYDWLSTWHRHIGSREGVKPAIVIGRHDGKILFVLPFALEPGALRRVRWLGAYLCNYSAPLLARDFSQRIGPPRFVRLWRDVQRLLRDRLRHDLLDLDKIPETIGEQANPMFALPMTRHANDAYLMHLPGNWDEYYAANRSSSRRRTDNKKRRRLAEFGEIQFSTAVDRADIETAIDALIEEKRCSYANLGVANMFEWPGYRDFFMDVACNPRRESLVHVSTVSAGERIVAANFALTFHGNYDYVLAGYDDGETAACSPGTVHLQELMRYCTERDFKTFDFNIGDEPYKHEWFDTEVKLFDHVVPMTLRGWGAMALMRSLRMLKRFIKHHPSIWPALRKARSIVGALRR